MLRISCRKLWTAPVLRCRLASFLLVLYVAAVYGLPALHLANHRNDHVHALGGLRWLRAVPAHVHATGQRHESLERDTDPKGSQQGPRQQLRTAPDASSTAAPHLAIGPAHGHSALLVPLHLVSLAPAIWFHCIDLSFAAPLAGELAAHHRARAPPLPV